MTNDTKTSDKVIDLITKLLAKAEDKACTTEEAEAFMAKAQDLMTRHAIDELMLDRDGGRTREPIVKEGIVYSATDQNLPAKQSLLTVIAKNNRCRALFIRKDGRYEDRKDYKAFLVGTPTDIAFTSMLYVSATMQCVVAFKRSHLKKTCAVRTGFMLGFANGVASRLEEANRKATEDTNGAALVLYNRKNEVDAAFAQMFPQTKALRSRTKDWQGYGPGQDAGQRADLSGGRNGLSSQKALGR